MYDLDSEESKIVKFLRYFRQIYGKGTMDEKLIEHMAAAVRRVINEHCIVDEGGDALTLPHRPLWPTPTNLARGSSNPP